MSATGPASGPFFLDVDLAADELPDASGQRFCLFHAPAANVACRGAVLAVHAFAEEMNKTRAAVAEGARALAAAGFAVLQIDLCGCGDSAGEFEDATWAQWQSDLDAAWGWLASRAAGPRWLWGTRFGALVARDFATRCRPTADGLLLWQPVVNGAQHLGQFLRLKTVNQLLREPSKAAPANAASAGASAASLVAPSPRADLAAGRSIEVAGYRLTPVLAEAMEAAKLAPSDVAPPRVCWLEVSSTPDATLGPMATRIVDAWRASGRDVTATTVAGSAFWQTLEVERCPALVAASVAAVCA